jgi:hypothetical protein
VLHFEQLPEFEYFREVACHVILSEAKNLALGVDTPKQQREIPQLCTTGNVP